MTVPKKAIPILKKTMERIDDGDGVYARLGNWQIALGGYDEGYVVSYRGEAVFRVNYELGDYEVLDQSIEKDVIEDMQVALDCQRFEDVTEWEDEDDYVNEEPIEEAGASVWCVVLSDGSETKFKCKKEEAKTKAQEFADKKGLDVKRIYPVLYPRNPYKGIFKEKKRRGKSGTEADEETKQKMVIAMDLKGWEQQGESLEFYNPSKDEGREFDNWDEVYEFILKLYGYK